MFWIEVLRFSRQNITTDQNNTETSNQEKLAQNNQYSKIDDDNDDDRIMLVWTVLVYLLSPISFELIGKEPLSGIRHTRRY